MKLFSFALACLLLLAAECAVLRPLPFAIARIDVHVAFIAFVVLRSPTLEGALLSFVAGYFLDVLSGEPKYLYVLSSMLTFLMARLTVPFIEVRSARGFVPLAMGLDLFHTLVAIGLAVLGTPSGVSRGPMFWGMLPTALLTGIAALGVWPLLKAVEARFKKPEGGLIL